MRKGQDSPRISRLPMPPIVSQILLFPHSPSLPLFPLLLGISSSSSEVRVGCITKLLLEFFAENLQDYFPFFSV